MTTHLPTTILMPISLASKIVEFAPVNASSKDAQLFQLAGNCIWWEDNSYFMSKHLLSKLSIERRKWPHTIWERPMLW